MSYPGSTEALSAQDTLDLRAYIRPVWRRKWIIVAVVALATVGTYLVSSRQAKQYVAATSVYITVVDPALAVGSVVPTTPPTAQEMQDISTLFTAEAITEAVYRRLGVQIGSAGSVTVAPVTAFSGGASATSFVAVTATSPAPQLAARLANTYVAVFLAERRSAAAAAARSDARAAERSLNTLAKIPVNASERQSLLLEISQFRTIAVNPSAGAQQIDKAVAPPSASSPKPARDALFGAVVGLLLAIGVAFALELLDRRLVRVSALESIYRRPILAVLPHASDPSPFINEYAAVPQDLLEPLRGLRVNLRLSGGVPPRTLLVVSGFPGEGKSTLARDLALVYADAGEHVLLIDADLRRPTIAWLCGLEPEIGLTHVLRGKARLAAAVVPVPRPGVPAASGTRRRRSAGGAARSESHGTLDLLAHGEEIDNPVMVLSSPAMKGLLAAASTQYDVILIDTAPILAVADTVPLLGFADAIVLVARLGVTTRDAAARVSEVVGRVPDANLVGIVANDAREEFLDERHGSYYGTYGEYGYGPGDTPGRKTTATRG